MNKAEICVPIVAGFLMIIGLAAYQGAWWQYVTAAVFFFIILPYCAITLEKLRQPDVNTRALAEKDVNGDER